MSSFEDIIQQAITSIQSGASSNEVIANYIQNYGSTNDRWIPPSDIVESANSIIVNVNIPGVSEDSIDVDFYNDKIEIKGERLKPYTNEKLLKNEIMYGRFLKKIILPMTVISKQSVKVSLDKGVLSIVIDKENEERNKFRISLRDC